MLTINLSKQASKDHRKHAKQIAYKLLELQENPFPNDSIQLKEHNPKLYRTSIGEYRIIYFAQEDTLFVVIIGKRNDGEVYKLLNR